MLSTEIKQKNASLEDTPPSNLYTLKQAASIIGVEYRQLLTAVNEGKVAHYQLGRSRRLVSIPEVIAAMKSQGVANG